MTPTTPKPLRHITASEFARRLNIDLSTQDKRYAFFLGSGCSVTSGIKTAGQLVTDEWLPKLRNIMAPEESDHEAWGSKKFGYDAKAPAASYGVMMKELFLQSEEQQREIERLCDNKFPAFGYSVLAELMQQTKSNGTFNVVLTTNFDDLVADALYLFTSIRPLIIHHESLAGYIRPTCTRPLIIKLHGDNHLSPYNTPEQTAALPEKTNQQVRNLLHDRGLIFLGYSGNDESIMHLLEKLPEDALPLGIYWCSETEPSCQLSDWLRKCSAIWVESPRFDEFMLLLHAAMDLGHPEPKRFEDVFERRMETYKKLTGHITQETSNTVEQAALKAAVVKTDKSFPSRRAILLEAYRLEKSDAKAAEAIYQEAIERFPYTSDILGRYALFLNEQKRPLEAEPFYKRAIKAKPTDAVSLGNYAIFLNEHKRFQEAEGYFKRALDADPSNHINLSNYARFLSSQKRTQEANSFYKRTIEADPVNAVNLVSYAYFLNEQKQFQEAEALYKRAIEADPNSVDGLSYYALFLNEQKRFQEADAFYKRAVKAGPDNAVALGHYAYFLNGQKRFQEAEAFYKRAIEADPIIQNLGNYALFLNEQKRFQEAEAFHKRTIEAESNSVYLLGGYAYFLYTQKRFQEAEAFYKRAIEADPTNSNNLTNYAQMKLANNSIAGLPFLESAQAAISSNDAPPLLLEINFYELAHRSPLGDATPLATIKQLLIDGKRSKTWDFSANVARAQQDGHPFAEWLPKLAAVIAAEAPLDTLDEWPEWQQAEA